jgi:hypothetical protein
MRIDSAGKIQIGNNIPMWSGSYGGALFLKGNNATADRYAQLAIVDSAGAIASQGLIVNTSGNVGIGTSLPAYQLEVGDGTDASETLNLKSSNTGSTNIFFSDAASNGQGRLTYTHSDNVLKIYTADSERMRIDSSGNLMVGTNTLADVNNLISNHLFEGANSTPGNAAVGVYNNTGTASCPVFNVLTRDASTDTSNRFVQFYANVTSTGATAMGGIVGNGASNVQFAAISDVREKQNIEALTNSLDKITSLNPVEFDWITSGEHCKAGFIAQEVEEVFPEFVVENMSSGGQEERKGLTGGMTGGIVAHLVKAIQEQQTLIESLTTE